MAEGCGHTGIEIALCYYLQRSIQGKMQENEKISGVKESLDGKRKRGGMLFAFYRYFCNVMFIVR
jgi:hypothetical protein